MLSKNKIKLIHALDTKKGRKQEGAFVAEGFKSVGDLLREGFHARTIIATEEWQCPVPLGNDTEVISVTDEELRKASLLLHPQQVIGIFDIPQATHNGGCVYGLDNMYQTLTPEQSKVTTNIPPNEGFGGSLGGESLILCLDGVQDPGNLGTIIRTADWFGIKHIICSPTTADAFNPKVVQATMGSISRVHISYTDLPQFLGHLPQGTPIYGTLLDGSNLYDADLQNHGVIVMGNEGNGISQEVRALLTHHLLIPSYPADSPTAESLNVSIATAIICAEFRRRG